MNKTPETILYIAVSLDGYIADDQGNVDWLSCVESSGEDYGYNDFFNSIDALIIGNKTYQQALSFGEWPYGKKPCWVCTKTQFEPPVANIFPSGKSPEKIIMEAREKKANKIWLVGGARLITSFRKKRLISRYIISTIPMILGKGIPLFLKSNFHEELRLVELKTYPTGLVQSTYVPQLP